MLVDIRDIFENHKAIVKLIFAERGDESESNETDETKIPISIIKLITNSLRETYRGLPLMLWAVCAICGARMIRWRDLCPPSSERHIGCVSCREFSKPPNLMQ